MATRMRKDPGPIPKAPSKKIPAGKNSVPASRFSPKGSQATMKRGTVVKPAIPKDKWGSAE